MWFDLQNDLWLSRLEILMFCVNHESKVVFKISSWGITICKVLKEPQKTLSFESIFCGVIGLRSGFSGARGVRPSLPLIYVITCFFCNHFEEVQTVLFEVELIINKAPLTYVYPNTIETCLTFNHLLFGRQLLHSSNTTSTVVRNLTVLSSTTDKINCISNHFLDR